MAKPRRAVRSATRSSEPYCPDADEFIWLDFDPQAGREQRGRRPALVLSPRSYNRASGLCVVCPLTSQRKGYPFEVANASGFAVGGVVLSDHVKSVSWPARRAQFIAKAAGGVVREVRAKLKALLVMA
jgi:mRNA interferase MazF